MMDAEEAFGLLKVIGRQAWSLENLVNGVVPTLQAQLKELEEAVNELRSGKVVHSDERASDNSGGDPPDGGAGQANNGRGDSALLSDFTLDT